MEKDRDHVDDSKIAVTVIARSADNGSSDMKVEAPPDVDVVWSPDQKTRCGEIICLTALALLMKFFELVYANMNNPMFVSGISVLYTALVVTGWCMTGPTRKDDERGFHFSMHLALFECLAFALLLGEPQGMDRLLPIVKLLFPVPYVILICVLVTQMIRRNCFI